MSIPLPRVIAVIAAVCQLMLVTGCGGSSDTPSTTTTTALTDAVRAEGLALRAGDLPAGFAAMDARSRTAVPMLNQCLPSLLGATATQIGESFLQGTNVVSSQSYVMASTTAASGAIATLGDAETRDCATELLRTTFAVSLDGAGIAERGDTAVFSPLDPATGVFMTKVERKTDSMTQTVAAGALLITQANRSVSAVWLTWLEGSPSETVQRSIVTALRARADSTFSR